MTYTSPKPTRLARVESGVYICEKHDEENNGVAPDFAYDDNEHECQWESEDSPCGDLDTD